MKNNDHLFQNMIIFIASIVLLIIDSPFIIFLGKYGLEPNALPLFLSILLLYNQLILPKIFSKIFDKISSDITLDDVYLVEKELKNKIKNESKNNDENKGDKSHG